MIIILESSAPHRVKDNIVEGKAFETYRVKEATKKDLMEVSKYLIKFSC